MLNNSDFFISIVTKFDWLGNWLFLFISLAECVPFVGSVFPGGTLIYLAGFFAAQGYFKPIDVFIFATLGAIIGDYSGYALGRWGGKWIEAKNIIKPKYMARGQEFFTKYGAKSIFWGRFIGATRAFIPFIAGTARMKQKSFFIWNVAGAIFWAFSHVALGYFSGSIISEIIRRWSHRLSLIATIVAIAIVLYVIFTRVIKKKHFHIIYNFQKRVEIIANQVMNKKWFQKVDTRYPVADELLTNARIRDRLFFWLTILSGLVILYFVVLILDLF